MLTALAIDAIGGWPDRLFRWIRHPVVWIGAMISGLDGWLNRSDRGRIWQLFAGASTTIVVVLTAAGAGGFLAHLLSDTFIGFVIVALATSSLFGGYCVVMRKGIVHPMRDGPSLQWRVHWEFDCPAHAVTVR
jgi:adenosylcobinamide-phosphate synthase